MAAATDASAAASTSAAFGSGRRAAASSPPSAPGRFAHSSSVTNGMTGCASASVSRSTCTSVAARSSSTSRAFVSSTYQSQSSP